MSIESNGGSSEYYQLDLLDGRRVECLDILEALGLDFAEGNILKALWRRSAWRRGVGKRGTPPHYDARKIAFFANRLVALASPAFVVTADSLTPEDIEELRKPGEIVRQREGGNGKV